MRLGATELREASVIGGRQAGGRARRPRLTVSGLALAAAALAPAIGAAQTAATPAPATTTSQPPAIVDKNDIVVNGIKYRDTVLPTRLSSSSVYGLDLGVMDTPRNNTLLSTTQLETLNVEDPRAFSYLTASSYTDSAFGTPNIPRIRGQYADAFYNGMRDSFTENGYGVPVNFDSLENISITKGPASVIDGPGPDVGGEVDLLTKRPSLSHFGGQVSATLDTVDNRRLVVDVGGPVIPGDLGVLISYAGEDSGSYFYGHYMRKNAIYAAVRWRPNDKYQLDFNTELNVEQYTEEVGVNRASQNLIDHGLYLQGTPVGELDSTVFGASVAPVSVGPQYYTVAPILTEVNLTDYVKINPRVTLDQTPGTSTRGLLYNAQLIQTYQFTPHLSLENNTFFAYQDSDNQEAYYYSDSSKGSFSIENRLDVKGDYDLPFSLGSGGAVHNQFVFGGTFRLAHVAYVANFSAEAVSVYDLTGNPNLWRFNPVNQSAADAFPYTTAFGKVIYGVPGRDSTDGGNTGVSDLYDTAIFFQDRLEFTPKLSVLFGARIDALQDHTFDPLGGVDCSATCFTDSLPQKRTTGVYGLGDGNISVVYKPWDWVSGYLTFDWTQSTNANGGEGGVNAYTQVPDSTLMRSDGYLYEAGLKFNLINNKLFVGTAVFDQKHEIATGQGGTQLDAANIRGVEMELNYQPTRNLFATASYSYINTTLNNAPAFYDYPAQLGLNVDGAGLFAVFQPNQKFQDPDQPQHVFNFLANYKFENGLGLRTGMQVTGPIPLTASGYLDPTASATIFGTYVPQIASVIAGVTNSQGYYKAPVIPWQYTWNAATFYQFGKYTITLSVYNLTDQRNWQPSPSDYGNDFLVLSDPRTFEVRFQAKF